MCIVSAYSLEFFHNKFFLLKIKCFDPIDLLETDYAMLHDIS